MSNRLPLRPNARQKFPEIVKRWNLMFADKGARNLIGQLKLHAGVCDDSQDCQRQTPISNVHESPDFVLWHRAFLFYHEQILGALGGGDVGLPYWDWSLDRLCPKAYVAGQFDFAEHLAHSANELGDENFAPEQVVKAVAALRSMPPAKAAVELFFDPIHQLPHSRLGWESRDDLMTAAGDPLFYGHHGNLDRLATHIFQDGWPPSSGIHYRFIKPDGTDDCVTLDAFATMPSAYEGDQPIDTSGYEVIAIENLDKAPRDSDASVRTKIGFSQALPKGSYQVTSGSGIRLGEIASIEHRGASNFVLWLSWESYRKAHDEGLRVAAVNAVGAVQPGSLAVSRR